MSIIKSRFTLIAGAIAVALTLSTSAFAAPAQTTGDGGYVATCGIDPTTGAALPCAPSSSSAQATGSESFAAGLSATASGAQPTPVTSVQTLL